jgi:hypothetical protein
MAPTVQGTESMSNANERANARALPERTNRRAVLGAILAGGAAAAAVLPASVANASALSPADLRALDLYRRYRRAVAISDRLAEQRAAAEDRLPDWARMGPKHTFVDGRPFSTDTVGWPVVADLRRCRPINSFGVVVARPNVEDICDQFTRAIRARVEREEATKELAEALAAFRERVAEQRAEQERVGYAHFAQREDDVTKVRIRISHELEASMGDSVLALAATLLIGIRLDDEEDYVIRNYRATLAAIRPQLVDVIAEDADKTLATSQEDANV